MTKREKFGFTLQCDGLSQLCYRGTFTAKYTVYRTVCIPASRPCFTQAWILSNAHSLSHYQIRHLAVQSPGLPLTGRTSPCLITPGTGSDQ
jgi:hypothetical protein